VKPRLSGVLRRRIIRPTELLRMIAKIAAALVERLYAEKPDDDVIVLR
jgi:hypothetical protein